MGSSALAMAAYFLVFASVHSLLADPRFKRWAKERACGALDRWGRLAFNLLALIMLLPFIFILLYLPDEVIYIAPWPAFGLMAAAQLLAAAMLLLSQSTNLPMFLASAVLYGIGQGAVHTSAQTLAILNAPKNRVGAANATFSTGFDAGIGFGAVLAGFLVGLFDYSGMFLCLAVCPVLALLFFTLRPRKSA